VSRVLYFEPETHSPGTPSCPVEALEQRDARRQMQSVLSRMTERRRTTFFLFEIEGYTGDEIAALEGVPVNTIYTRLYHARRDFMKLLAESQGFEEVP
jgi:RNA polymerase sigma-70 factor (ECF subfamily)